VIDSEQLHIPVLVDEMVGKINPAPGKVGLDCTVGGGGHARAVIQAASGEIKLVGIDVDPQAIEQAERQLRPFAENVTLVRRNFSDATQILTELNINQVDFIYADLGASSLQLSCPARGFSFARDGPLDMRFDPDLTTRAADLVNSLGESELSDLIFRYGQDTHSRKIARLICRARRNSRLDSTVQLAELVCWAVGLDPVRIRPGRKHPATRTFQALRIAVNNELGQLEQLLDQAPGLLACGGVLAIISFHSLEDSIVKQNFRKNARAGTYRVLTGKPIVPREREVLKNPRSRSAKLRAVEKVA